MAEQTFPVTDFDAQQQQLQRRRQLAQQLVRQGLSGNTGGGYQGGRVFMVGSPLGNVAAGLAGQYLDSKGDAEQQDLVAKRAQAQNDWQAEFAAADSPAAKQQALVNARNRGLRSELEQQFYNTELAQNEAAAKAELDRIEKGEQLAADRVLKAEEGEANRQNRIDAKATPSIHISAGGGRGGIKAPSGYRYNEDGTALEPIPGGPADKSNATKPLTQKQLDTQRGFMDMASSLDTYEQMLDKYDPQGKSAASPAQRAALESAFTDVQMKLKTLYELGAPQAGDMRLLEQSFNNPTSTGGTIRGAAFGKDPFKAKVQQARQLLKNSQANFEKQMGKETPEAAKPTAAAPKAPAVVRSAAEWQALEPGTSYTTPDGKQGVR